MAQRKNKAEVLETTSEVSEAVHLQKPQLPKWKVISGGITLRNGAYYKKGDIFEAEENQIPEAFRDLIMPLQPVQAVAPAPVVKKRKWQLIEVVPTADEQDDENYVQLYNLANEEGKVLTETPQTKDFLQPIIDEVNK